MVSNIPVNTHDYAVFRFFLIYNNLYRIIVEREFILGDEEYLLLPKIKVPYRNRWWSRWKEGYFQLLTQISKNDYWTRNRFPKKKNILTAIRIKNIWCYLFHHDCNSFTWVSIEIRRRYSIINREDWQYTWEYTPLEKNIAKSECRSIKG